MGISHRAGRGHIALQLLAHHSAKTLASILPALGVAACSWAPLKYGTSLSPAIHADTTAYSDAVGDAADEILLANIVRAMYQQPLNLSQLSSISGSLSFQGTLGFTLPWGKGSMGGNPVTAQNQVAPSVTASTTPTYSVTPLNTQAFTLSILQPVSPAYVLNRWQAGLSREMLLLLFVKEIDFPNPDSPGIARKFINDPDNEGHFEAFKNLIGQLVAAKAELKAIDVMDPVGPAFGLFAVTSQTSTVAIPATDKQEGKPAQPPSTTTTTVANPTNDADSTGFGLVTGANDLQYHVGNVKKWTTDKDGTNAIEYGGQLYRVYSGQVVMCVSKELFQKGLQAINLDQSQQKVPQTSIPNINSSRIGMLNSLGAPSSGGPAAPPGSGPAAKAGSTSGAAAPTTGQAVTAALQANRISGLFDATGCGVDELVLPQSAESEFQEQSSGFIHIQWRSVSEIFDYLGAVLRYNERSKDPEDSKALHDRPVKIYVQDDDSVESCVAHVPAAAGLQKKCEKRNAAEAKDAVLFQVTHEGSVRVSYNLRTYGIEDRNTTDPNSDYSMTILSMLSTLVNLSAQPSISASTSQPLRLLPIP